MHRPPMTPERGVSSPQPVALSERVRTCSRLTFHLWLLRMANPRSGDICLGSHCKTGNRPSKIHPGCFLDFFERFGPHARIYQ